MEDLAEEVGDKRERRRRRLRLLQSARLVGVSFERACAHTHTHSSREHPLLGVDGRASIGNNQTVVVMVVL